MTTKNDNHMSKGYTIHTDDLPGELQDIAGQIGLGNMMVLVKHFGGERIYFPTLKRITLQGRNRAIRSEFNGRNYRELARQYGLTTVRIRQILSDRTK